LFFFQPSVFSFLLKKINESWLKAGIFSPYSHEGKQPVEGSL
jgi:hypothetical protein